MNLLLTSQGLSSKALTDFVKNRFKDVTLQKAALIYTIREPEDKQWMSYRYEEFKAAGIKNFDEINISKEVDLSDLKGYDIYYVCGGNTFYILDRIKKTGLDKTLMKEIKKGKLYIGSSAGSIIMGSNINIAEVGEMGDENDIELKDLKGFNLVNFEIFPHYEAKEDRYIKEYKAKTKNKIIALTDTQGLLVDEWKARVI